MMNHPVELIINRDQMDCIGFALRLRSESRLTMGPEVVDALDRWEHFVVGLLDGSIEVTLRHEP
jgi:hypothetical protein